MKLSHLICDCDGVLLDSESVALAALVDGLSQADPALSSAQLEAFIQPRLGMTLTHILAELTQEWGIVLSTTQAQKLDARVEARCIKEAQAIPGVRAALIATALPLALASNSSYTRVEAGLKNAGLWDLFAPQVYTPDAGLAPKPAADLYLAACAGLGANAASTLVLEDSVAGVMAARAAGLKVLGFMGARHGNASTAQRLLNAGAYDVFDDMQLLQAHLAAWQ